MSAFAPVLEQISIVTPLGVRFWDVALSAPAGAGLTVVAYRNVWPELTYSAVEGRSGIYSFRALPGMQYASSGACDDAYWSAYPPVVPYLLSVTDQQQRYLPFQLSLTLPCRGLAGLFASPLSTSLTPDPTWIPVFSLPSRPIGAHAGAIRAQVQDDTTGQPAPWAMVTARSSANAPVTGIADARGVISLALPYPEPRNFAFSSPSGSSIPLTDQTWPVDIQVFYTPRAANSALPFLEDLLEQPAVAAWMDTAHSAPAGGFLMSFGNDLILRSRNSANGTSLPVLIITSA